MVSIAVAGIAVSTSVMILSLAILTGFKNQVHQKITGFGSHITITNYDNNSSYETRPIRKNQHFYPSITQNDGIRHIQVFAIKAGIIKTEDDIEGVVIKGVDQDFDWSFFKQNIIEGRPFKQISEGRPPQEAVISGEIARLLKVGVGDTLLMHFVVNKDEQHHTIYRKFSVTGIYQSSLEEYDRLVLTDIRHVQRLNHWEEDQISGFEILIDDFDDLDAMGELVFNLAGNYFTEEGSRLQVRTIKQVAPQIFNWLNLSDMNVIIIITLMTLVAGFNMISGILILIIERTNTIGVLKALGLGNLRLRNLFLLNACFLTVKGLLFGNLIGISLCLLQLHLDLIPLNPETYYVDSVPINLTITHLVLLNVGTLIVTLFMQLLPTYLTTRIQPIKAIRFN